MPPRAKKVAKAVVGAAASVSKKPAVKRAKKTAVVATEKTEAANSEEVAKKPKLQRVR